MYKLTEEEFQLQGKITPGALRGLKELGLYNSELTPDKETETLFSLITDPLKMEALSKLIFVIDKKIDYDEISLQEFLRGYKDFFVELTKSFG